MQETVQVVEEVMVLMEASDHPMAEVVVVAVEWVAPRKTLVPIYKPPTGTVSN